MSKYTGRFGSISLAPSGGSTYTEVAQVASIGAVGTAADETEVTTLDNLSGFKEFLQTFKDSGELPVTLIWDPDLPGHGSNAGGLWALFASGQTLPVRLTFPTRPTQWVADFAAFVKAFPTPALTPADALTADVSLRVSGTVTLSQGGIAPPLPGGSKILTIDESSVEVQTAFVSTAFSYPLAVLVTDAASGDPAAGVLVTFAPPSAEPKCTLSALTALSGAGGVASVTATASATVGEYDVTASCPDMAEAVVFHLINRI